MKPGMEDRSTYDGAWAPFFGAPAMDSTEASWLDPASSPAMREGIAMGRMRDVLDRWVAPFHRLRWKLTLSYMLVTVAAILVVEWAVILVTSHYIAKESLVRPQHLLQELEARHIPAASTYLSETPPNIARFRASLRDQEEISIETQPIQIGNFLFSAYSPNLLSVVFLTPNGAFIDSLPHDFVQGLKPGEQFEVSGVPGLQEPLQAAFAGVKDYSKLFTYSGRNRMVGALPIFDELGKGKVVGSMIFVQKLDLWEVLSFPQIARIIGVSLLFITAFAAVMGSVFGSQTSRGLVKRLKQPLAATQAWSRGDFSALAHDPSPDELGALARGLNQMAAQLENLLDERQERSVMGERVRLARDLHDSIKQQAFAASAQLAAAQAQFKANPEKAQIHLVETDRLLDSMRQELASLIHELRPPAMQGRGLTKALQAYAQDCATQSGMDIDVHVQDERWLSVEMEQALFRIAQGALSNVVRHSQATFAEVNLIFDEQTVTLSVADNGCGFNTLECPNGLGLRLMRERAELLRGNLLIRSEPGAGTIVRLKCGIEQAVPAWQRG